jgi:hypothetical protein
MLSKFYHDQLLVCFRPTIDQVMGNNYDDLIMIMKYYVRIYSFIYIYSKNLRVDSNVKYILLCIFSEFALNFLHFKFACGFHEIF